MKEFKEALEEIQKVLPEIKEILVVFLYGSVARDEHTKYSDLDLYIVVNKKLISDKLKEKINDKLYPMAYENGVKLHLEFQSLDIKPEDKSILKKIIEEGKIIYSSGVFSFTSDIIGLKSYVIYGYKAAAKNKSLFSKIIHGRKSWYYKGKKKIVKEYEGIADDNSIILLGGGCLMVKSDKKNIIEQLFKQYNVEYNVKRMVFS